MILAADVGATHSRRATFADGARDPDRLEIYASAEHASLEEIIRVFLGPDPVKLAAATFGVAGPVHAGRTAAVNLAWPVDAATIAAELGAEPARVTVINDMEANAWGLAVLADDDLAALNEATADPQGTIALISAGTGLGEAFIVGGAHGAPHASEGGHVDFAPRSEIEAELRLWLASREGHISVERVCSGQGLVNVYEFLRERAPEPEPDWLARERAAGEEAAAITDAGLSRSDPVASEALDLLVSIYGAQAGNLALTVLATGGVYLGGGIAPRIETRLHEGGFIAAFTGKGRMSELLAGIPVWVIRNDRAALLGAARHAAGVAAQRPL